MQLKDYIQGNRHGREANRLEREAMRDPFLQDALEGFDAVQGDHAEIIERLEKRFANPDALHDPKITVKQAVAPGNNRRLYLYWSAAASVLLLIGLGAFFLFERNDNNKVAVVTHQLNDLNMEIPDAAQTSQLYDAAESIQDMPVEDEAAAIITPPEIAIQTETPDGSQAKAQAKVTPSTPAKPEAAPTEISEEKLMASEQATEALSEASEEKDDDFIFKLAEEKQLIDAAPRNAARQADRSRAAHIVEKKDGQKPFEKKEFQAYCREKADKNTCDGKKVTVKVSFFINDAGKPTNIKYGKYTCENAKKEVGNLLSSSPAWTIANKKVTMTIQW